MAVRPFSLLIKPASADCNLRCKYCFYIDHLALYPETKVHRMSDETLEKMIKTYMATDQPVYTFGWQGGEPTLMGVEFFRKAVALQKKYAKPGVRIANGLQTNATLITDEFAKFLAEYNFLVGVSVDGPAYMHDKHRVDINGKGTHARVLKGIENLRNNNVEFNILTLVNSSNIDHPKEVYNYLKDMGINYHQYIPCVEFDENNNHLPFSITGEQWGKFLNGIFDEWVKEDTRVISVRLFDSILSNMVYGWANVCHMRGNCCQYFVVEHNGDIYPCDFFVEKKRQIGNVYNDDWEDMQNSDRYIEFGKLKNQWNKKCTTCKYLFYCSGDCLKHRIYNNGESQRLSWLCQGWRDFYDHTLDKFRDLGRELLKERQGMPGTPNQSMLFEEMSFDRNEECFCGSGIKYKYCHGKAYK